MSKLLTIIAVCLGLFGLVALIQLERVENGYVGIQVDLLGSDKGTSEKEVGPGRYWIGINQDLYLFPTFSQTYTWEADGEDIGERLSFQSAEGMDIGADMGITYSIDPTKVHVLYQRYRKGIEEITDIYLRNMVRDAMVREASGMPVEAIYGAGKTAMIEKAEDFVRSQVADYGIIVESIYFIGALDLPQKVDEAIDSEIAANSLARRSENEVASAIAEAKSARERAGGTADAVLIEAAAQAKANTLLAGSLTPEVLQSHALAKWNGVLPAVTGGVTPMIDVSAITN